MARQLGYTDREVEALDGPAESGPFDPPLRIALQYAELVTRDPHEVSEDFFAELRRHYQDPEIVELTSVIGMASYWNRFSSALRIDLSGTDEPYDLPCAPKE